MKQIIDYWDPNHGIATCIFNYKNRAGVIIQGIGMARCHPEDNEFISKFTGGTIAEYRARIDLLKKINNYELKPSIASLKHVYCTMLHSKRYNPKSYEATRLKKELAHLMDELEINKEQIKLIKKALNTYINEKDKIHHNGQK